MIARISSLGELSIKRNNRFVLSHCPFQKDKLCGDWCALFGEIEDSSYRPEATLKLCHKEIIGDIADERR